MTLVNIKQRARPDLKITFMFTVELEKDGTLPFLDILLQRKQDGSLNNTVHRKPPHTDQYLHFNSHHPTYVEKGLVRCLYDRARNIVISQEDLLKEEDHLTCVLGQNGYPVISFATLPPLPYGQPMPPRKQNQKTPAGHRLY